MKNITRALYLFIIVVLGLGLGLIVVSFYASRSVVVKSEIEKKIQQMFEREYGVTWQGHLESIDLVGLELKFSHASVTDPGSNLWSLYAESFVVTASWLDLILKHTLNCHGHFDQMVVQQKESGKKPGVLFFLEQLFAASSPSFINFDVVTIQDGQVLLEDEDDGLLAAWKYNCQASQESDGMHVQTYFLDGHCHYKGQHIFENLFGSINSVIPSSGKMSELFARVDCRLLLPKINEQEECFFVGDVYNGHANFVLSNNDQSFIVEPLKITLDDDRYPFVCSFNADASLFQKLCGFEQMSDITGFLTLTFQGNLKDTFDHWLSTLHIRQLLYKKSPVLSNFMLQLHQNKKKQFQATLSVGKQKYVTGIMSYNHGVDFSFGNIANVTPWWESYWNVAPRNALVKGSFNSAEGMQLHYDVQLDNQKLEKTARVRGDLSYKDTLIALRSKWNDKDIVCDVETVPELALKTLVCKEQDKILFDLSAPERQHDVKGFIDFNLIQEFMPEKMKFSFSQEGKIMMQGKLAEGTYKAKVSTDNAHIRIPGLYNVVKDFTATSFIDGMQKSVSITDFIAHLYEGTLHSKKAVAMIDDMMQISFLHAPLFLNDVLLSWDKGIFGILSGRVLLQKKIDEEMECVGNVILEKAQLKGNIFSAEFQEKLFGRANASYKTSSVCNLDLHVETKEPVYVKTSFMEAQSHVDLHVTGTAHRPNIQGTVDLVSGSLDFPYKPLTITHGRVSFMNGHSQDPMIEIVAKGKIKRFYITLHATGTVFDQQIKFESSPHLTEEQIVSLLMIGAADSSLSIVMPAFFMQKLKDIIFGPAMSKSKLEVVFDKLLRPFKYVRFFPQFTNQVTGGGMRGVLEVDVTDRLQARIDSNIPQFEDTRFEVDYALTDDITIRGVRDKPSMYGGEVEMRWRFQ